MRHRLEDLYPDSTLFVANIPYDMNESAFQELLPNRSEVIRVSFPGHGPHRGYAFVAYPNKSVCQHAVDILNAMPVNGRHLICRFARDAARPPPRRADYERGYAYERVPRMRDDSEMGRFVSPECEHLLSLLREYERRPPERDLEHLSTEELWRTLARHQRFERLARVRI
jgi:RNA recognition motif-containing protein